MPEGTDTPTVRVLPEEEWDDELQKAAEDVYWRTGKEVEYVLGALEVYGSDGKHAPRPRRLAAKTGLSSSRRTICASARSR